MTAVTFVIPIRHQDNARDWGKLKENLSQTIASIENQRHDDWRAVIVANEGADLPALPPRFEAVRVGFNPNDGHDLAGQSRSTFWDAFRIDKGRRVLAGMLAARDSLFFMVVDDDDLISSKIVGHVAMHPMANGWSIDRGYIWDDGGRLLLGHNNFNHLCGTSLIVRADLYGLPDRFEDVTDEWVKTTLGSHVQVAELLAERGTPLATLPFRGALYRVAHGGSHSGTPSMIVRYFNRAELRRPKRLMGNLSKLRLVGRGARREFFGRRSI